MILKIGDVVPFPKETIPRVVLGQSVELLNERGDVQYEGEVVGFQHDRATGQIKNVLVEVVA